MTHNDIHFALRTERCPDCGTTGDKHPSTCRYQDDSCARGCPSGECYCAESTDSEIRGECGGCGGEFGECYCDER